MSTSAPTLKRSLGLWELVIVGIIMIQPTAPMPLFGVASDVGHGHVATTVLIAMVAMLFTAVSYGRMARVYPSAGSAYTYVGEEVHPVMGYLTGWSMLMDYALNPLICTVWSAKAAENLVPGIPGPVWLAFFAILFTVMNLRKIQATARTNQILTVAMGIVIVWVLIAVAKYVMHQAGVNAAYFTRPFYDPATFTWDRLSHGTALAVLTYIGFDGISTLSEEVENPRRNILLATVMVCLIIGVMSTIEVYAGQLVWPYGEKFPNLETAYVHMAGRAGGQILFQVLNFTLLVATIGSGSGAQLAGARLLYGMGRDGALPRRIFGQIDPKTNIPRNAVLVLGAVALIGSFILTYDLGAELLNFGALLGFIGVNLAALLHYYARAEHKKLIYLIPPLLGCIICFYIWISLSTLAKTVGGVWLLAGVLYRLAKGRTLSIS